MYPYVFMFIVISFSISVIFAFSVMIYFAYEFYLNKKSDAKYSNFLWGLESSSQDEAKEWLHFIMNTIPPFRPSEYISLLEISYRVREDLLSFLFNIHNYKISFANYQTLRNSYMSYRTNRKYKQNEFSSLFRLLEFGVNLGYLEKETLYKLDKHHYKLTKEGILSLESRKMKVKMHNVCGSLRLVDA